MVGRGFAQIGRETDVSVSGAREFAEAGVDVSQRQASPDSAVLEMDGCAADLDGVDLQVLAAGEVLDVEPSLGVEGEPEFKTFDADGFQGHVAAGGGPGGVERAELDRQTVGGRQVPVAFAPADSHTGGRQAVAPRQVSRFNRDRPPEMLGQDGGHLPPDGRIRQEVRQGDEREDDQRRRADKDPGGPFPGPAAAPSFDGFVGHAAGASWVPSILHAPARRVS